jgi:hypothetical protein
MRDINFQEYETAYNSGFKLRPGDVKLCSSVINI